MRTLHFIDGRKVPHLFLAFQDIRDCSGPLSELTELNTKVKEKFQQLKQRIQVSEATKPVLEGWVAGVRALAKKNFCLRVDQVLHMPPGESRKHCDCEGDWTNKVWNLHTHSFPT
jgi:hypothetical protein